MTEPSPKYGLYLRNLTKLMEAPNQEVLGVMKESLEWAARVSNRQHYMDLMMTASHAAQVADRRQLDWRSTAREHARGKGLNMVAIEEWISGIEIL